MNEDQYFDLVDDIYRNGKQHPNRTGVDALRKVCYHNVYPTDYGTSFNAVTHKPLNYVSVIAELQAFWIGATSAADFRERGCNVWNGNANKHGVNPNPWLSNPFRDGEDHLGPIYGKQWRRWEDTKTINVGRDWRVHINGVQIPTTDFVPPPVEFTEGQEPTPEELHADLMHRRLLHMQRLGYVKLAEFLGPNEELHFVLRREIDQLRNTINNIIKDPNNRRMIISAWNPADLEFIALPACHTLQHYLCTVLTEDERLAALKARLENDALWDRYHKQDVVAYEEDGETGPAANEEQWLLIQQYDHLSHDSLDQWSAPTQRLDLVMWQRSADVVLGVPFNIASYDAMINFVARITNTAPGNLHHVTSDTHIYCNHTDAAQEILDRGSYPNARPRLLINPALKTIEDFDKSVPSDFVVIDYASFPKLESPTPMAV